MEKFNYKKYLLLMEQNQKKVNIISKIRMVTFLLIIFLLCLASKNSIYYYLAVISIVIFMVLIIIHDTYYKKLDYYTKYVDVLNTYKDRINGNWKNFKDTGIEYQNETLSDLDVVGENSLFQYINVCRTRGGKNKLIKKLSNFKIDLKEFENNQKAINELTSNIKFIIDFLVKLTDLKENINLEENIVYLEKKVGRRVLDLLVAVLFSGISLLLLILGILKILPLNYFYGIFIFNFLINYMYSFIFHEEFKIISQISANYSKLKGINIAISKTKFQTSKLQKLQKTISKSQKCIEKLIFLDELNNLKNNILSSFIFNGLFCINIVVMYMYSQFQENDHLPLKNNVFAIEEMESLLSLTSIGLTKTETCLPILTSTVELDFKNIKHPLLVEKKCVGNDFQGKAGVNIITGSNMGGKTSFLRTIGINLILMYSGSCVCASNFKCCYLKIFTSMRVKDDIDKGISTFYAELLRIKKAIDYNSNCRILLVDEIFKGTNYNDRIFGAKNVIKKLNDGKTIIFITTHDFELCKTSVDNLQNYYVKEYYEGDNIFFDYKIRKGQATSTNAKYLMKKLNIIE